MIAQGSVSDLICLVRGRLKIVKRWMEDDMIYKVRAFRLAN